MTQYSFFGPLGNGANGPASSISFGGAFVAGLAFKVTSSGQYLYGYYVWRADSGQSASCSCALWVLSSASAGTFQTGTSASTSSMVTGQWNYIPLAAPFLLSTGTTYKAVYGLTGNFCDTQNQFGGGTDPYKAGIVNGPITAFSSPVGQGGTNEAPFTNTFQGSFGTSGSDPTTNLPSSDDVQSNFFIDIQVGPAQAAAVTPPPGLPVRARILPARPGGATAELGPGSGNISGAVGAHAAMGASGAPVRNPVQGPSFRQAVRALRARLPLQPLLRGRTASNPGSAPRNPVRGPVFRQATTPARAVFPPPHPRAGRIASNRGGPVRNPVQGPPVRALPGPVRARQPLPPKGRTGSNPGGPVRNPVPSVAGPPFFPARQAIRIRPSLPPRGRTASNPGGAVRNPRQGPLLLPAGQPAGGPVILLRTGVAMSTPVPQPPVNPPPLTGPPFTPVPRPVRSPIPQTFSKGRVSANPGSAPRNPATGPVFFPAVRPVRAPVPQVFSKGRTAGSPGGPLANPSRGPAFRQATSPVRIHPTLPPRGRIASNPGGPVQNPPPPVLGPVFTPKPQPARIRPSLPPRGRIAGGSGAPVRNPAQGAAFPAARGPVQARFPLPPRGRTAGNPGIPVPPPVTHTGPPFIPLHWPARIHPVLPPRGRISANPGTVPRNPQRGPVFTQAVRPIRAVIPQNAPRGRTSGNPGGPVANIPFVRWQLTTGQPFFLWEPQEPFTLWEAASPVTAWQTGVPFTSE